MSTRKHSHPVRLTLVLTGHWYDTTARGAKLIEYRKMSPHWKRMIWERREQIATVRFSRGYSKQTMTFNVTKIDIGPCPLPGWNGLFYRVHFKERTA
ncbi:MAG: hypothetical protein BWY57_02995 [Betaproteobacteria bacterium ADurb.Bin341]|jgi:hypothetical protein|nr:MAG: hypothetical protein BWY57_02995 [Betaproteobacteria bacterium ADurb.Bin341]